MYHRHARPGTLLQRRKAAGLSLLEIVIALGLGLVLLAGATNLFIGSSQTFNVNESLSRMQEDARFAMNRLARDARMAGFRGCSPNINNRLDITAGSLEERLFFSEPLVGWDYNFGAAAAPIDLTAYEIEDNGANWQNGSGDGLHTTLEGRLRGGGDALVVNRAVPIDAALSGNPKASASTIGLDSDSGIGLGAQMLIIQNGCMAADLFRKTNDTGDQVTAGSTGNVAPGFTFEEVEDVDTLLQLQSKAFYIGEDDGVPTLYEHRLDGDSPGARALVRGVENMQVRYGVATGGHQRAVGNYVDASAVDDWNDVLGVRISLLMRSVEPVNSLPNARIYNLSGVQVSPSGLVDASGSEPAGDSFIRLVATRTIGLRNRLP